MCVEYPDITSKFFGSNHLKILCIVAFCARKPEIKNGALANIYPFFCLNMDSISLAFFSCSNFWINLNLWGRNNLPEVLKQLSNNLREVYGYPPNSG
jgi:hypothetical protein